MSNSIPTIVDNLDCNVTEPVVNTVNTAKTNPSKNVFTKFFNALTQTTKPAILNSNSNLNKSFMKPMSLNLPTQHQQEYLVDSEIANAIKETRISTVVLQSLSTRMLAGHLDALKKLGFQMTSAVSHNSMLIYTFQNNQRHGVSETRFNRHIKVHKRRIVDKLCRQQKPEGFQGTEEAEDAWRQEKESMYDREIHLFTGKTRYDLDDLDEPDWEN